MRIEFFFDFACPFAYIASREIEGVAARTGAELVWCPILLGGVLRAIGSEQLLARQPAARTAYSHLDRVRCAEVRGAPLSATAIHPQSTVRALRTVLSVEDGPARVALIHELYRAYWERGERLEEDSVLRRALDACGIPVERPLAAGDDPDIKQELRRRTDEAVARGVFGVPTAIVETPRGELLFWGQDRLEQLEAVLGGWHPADGHPPARAQSEAAPAAGGDRAVIEFWYDFSSPWAYIASTQVERVAARAGARLVWRPMLLGAVFKQIGQATVPLFEMPDAKRRWTAADLDLWSAWWGVPFRFTSHFPQRSLTALRLALLAGEERIAALSHALFRAAWVEDWELDDEATLLAVVDSVGLDGAALLAQAREPAAKQALVDSTAAAVAGGVFGAPSFHVRRAGTSRLFFGQDRLDQVERAARGDAAPAS
jgi:2-hydroxychromene-2-carboxylate isomerase